MAQTDKYAVIEGKAKALYDSGKVDGYEEGFNTGYAEGDTAGYLRGSGESFDAGQHLGRQAEHRELWDSLTQNNTRTDYKNFGSAWNDDTWKPPYALQPVNGNYMFAYTNIKEALYYYPLDLSKCKYADQMFAAHSSITKLPVLDLRSLENSPSQIFWGQRSIKWIEGIKLNNNADLSSIFNEFGFEHIIFDFVISRSLNLTRGTTLDKETIESAMNNLSTTNEGCSVTFATAAINKDYETSEGANDGSTSEEWLNKVASRPNWTIYLV